MRAPSCQKPVALSTTRLRGWARCCAATANWSNGARMTNPPRKSAVRRRDHALQRVATAPNASPAASAATISHKRPPGSGTRRTHTQLLPRSHAGQSNTSPAT